MTTPVKYREFDLWVNNDATIVLARGAYKSCPVVVKPNEVIKVIEYAALTAAQDEITKLKDQVAVLSYRPKCELMEEIARLKEEIEEMKAALRELGLGDNVEVK